MAATQPGHRDGSGGSDLPLRPLGPEACVSMTAAGPDRQQVSTMAAKALQEVFYSRYRDGVKSASFPSPRPRRYLWKSRSAAGATWLLPGRLRTGKEQEGRAGPRGRSAWLLRTVLCFLSSFRSPESVEMDEIMAAMVLTSLSCSPVVQSPPQADPGPGRSPLHGHDIVKRHLHTTKQSSRKIMYNPALIAGSVSGDAWK